MEIFEAASKNKLRFPIGGTTSTEQLWDVQRETLVNYEEALEAEVEKLGKSSRRKRTVKTKAVEELELRLAIVSHILNVREAEEVNAREAAETKAHNQKILALVQAKREEKLSTDRKSVV